MKKFMIRLLSAIIFLTLTIDAGVYIKSVDIHGDNPKENTSNIFIEKDRIRVQMETPEQFSVIIFRHDKQVMWMIDEQNKTYSEITKDDLAELKKRMDSAQAMMAEQMKNLPAEQRQMMEQMMKKQMQQMPSMEKPKIEYKKAGQEKIEQWPCTKYEGFVDGKKTSDVWAVSWDKLGFSADDFEGLKHMGEFFEVLNQKSEEFFNLETFQGLPVKIQDYENGKLRSKTQIKEITAKNCESSLFELPSGLTKKDLMPGNMEEM